MVRNSFIAALVASLLSALALAPPTFAALIARPTLTTPTTWDVPVAGGFMAFGANEDVCIDFPNAAVVTGTVGFSGGRNVIVGCDIDDGPSGEGGHIQLPFTGIGSDKIALFVNSPNATGVYHIEGMIVDAGTNCDAIAFRNQNLIQITVTIQNSHLTGMGFNRVDTNGDGIGDCHGDAIQFQGPFDLADADAGFTFTAENVSVSGDGQGFGLFHENGGTASVTLINTYARQLPITSGLWGQYYFWDAESCGTRCRPYSPVTLTNVWADYLTTNPALYPNSGTTVAGPPIQYSWAGAGDFGDTNITGVVNQGFQPESVFDDFPANAGLNYSRTWFDTGADPGGSCATPAPSTNIANATTHSADSGNFNDANGNVVGGLWDGCVDGSAPCTPGNTGITSFWVEFDLGADYDLDSARICGDASGGWVSENWTMEYDEVAKDGYTAHFTAADATGTAWFNAADVTGLDNIRWVKFTVNSPIAGSTQAREIELVGTPSAVAPPSTRLVTSPDATDLPTNETLTNEIKGDVNAIIGELDANSVLINTLIAQVQALQTNVPAHTHPPSDGTDHSHAVSQHQHTENVPSNTLWLWCTEGDTSDRCSTLAPPE